VIVNAAFVDFILGLGLSVLGAGGGRATVCGDAASENIGGVVAEGMTTGGGSEADCLDGPARGCSDDNADIIARRTPMNTK